MAQENSKNEYATRKDLEEQAQVIIGAVDSILTIRLDGIKEELCGDINNVQVAIDGYVKNQEDFKQEFTIMKEEMKQTKQVIKEKLGVQISAA
jgi:hypothetical protein